MTTFHLAPTTFWSTSNSTSDGSPRGCASASNHCCGCSCPSALDIAITGECRQFARIRNADLVMGSELETENQIHLLSAGGQHDDERLMDGFFTPDQEDSGARHSRLNLVALGNSADGSLRMPAGTASGIGGHPQRSIRRIPQRH